MDDPVLRMAIECAVDDVKAIVTELKSRNFDETKLGAIQLGLVALIDGVEMLEKKPNP